MFSIGRINRMLIEIMKEKTQRTKTSISVHDRENRDKKLTSTSSPNAKTKALELLQAGEVIAIPTDTVYGLACSANNTKAISQLYKIKGRHKLKPVAICVASIDELRLWGETDHLSFDLLKELLPGAVTIVVKRSSNLNKALNPEEPKIGIRITKNRFIQKVCKAFKEPIALTSANKSSSQSTLNVSEFKDLWPYLGAVFDGGRLSLSDEQRAASTVIDLSEKDFYKIIRYGVSVEEIINIVEKYNIRLAAEL